MKEEPHWEPLVKCRLRSLFIIIYKISNELIDIPATSYLTPGDNRTRGAKYNVQSATTCGDVYKFSFFPRTIRD